MPSWKLRSMFLNSRRSRLLSGIRVMFQRRPAGSAMISAGFEVVALVRIEAAFEP